MTSVGQEIRKYRRREKLTQESLAKKAGLSRSYIADIERDRYNPSVETIKTIAIALDVPLYLLLGKESPESHEESELADIPIERLNEYKLSYKGHELSKEEADDIIVMLEAALKRWKK